MRSLLREMQHFRAPGEGVFESQEKARAPTPISHSDRRGKVCGNACGSEKGLLIGEVSWLKAPPLNRGKPPRSGQSLLEENS